MVGKTSKTTRQLERYLKGAANHWRLDILFLLEKKGELTLDEIINVFIPHP